MIEDNTICDIHCHMLPDVDDGAQSFEESVRMLDEAAAQHVSSIILTPHHRPEYFPYSKQKIDMAYEKLAAVAAEKNIRLYKGCECHVDGDMLDNVRCGFCDTLAGSDYILSEFSGAAEFDYIRDNCYRILSAGYVPVIAHAERVISFRHKPKRLNELKEMGVLIQINADAVLGIDGHEMAAFTKMLIKKGIADVIAGDSHNLTDRPLHMQECYEFTSAKFGAGTARQLMYENPMMIIKNEYLQ